MPTRREYSGNAPATTLSGPITNASTSFTVTDGTGYPTGDVGPFFLVIDPRTASEEKVLVTTRTGTTMSGVARGQDGTSAVAHSAGAAVEHVWTAVDAGEANRHGADTTLDDHTQYHNAARHGAVAHTTAMIGDGQVTTAKIADAAVTVDKLVATIPRGVLTVGGSQNTTAAVALGQGNTEAIRLTSAAIQTFAGRRYKITHWMTRINGGTDGYMEMRVRRGTTTAGTQVALAQFGRGANGRTQMKAVAFDTPGAVASQQYCVGFLTDAGTTDLYEPSGIVVEDVGPA